MTYSDDGTTTLATAGNGGDVQAALDAGVAIAGSKAWMTTRGVLFELHRERAAQDAKWGEQNYPDGTGPKTVPLHQIVRGPANIVGDTHFAFGLALQAKGDTDRAAKAGTLTFRQVFLEEVFEAIAEEDPDHLRTELIQVAAVAVEWVEAIDRRTS